MKRILLFLVIGITSCTGPNSIKVGSDMEAVRSALGIADTILEVSRDSGVVFVHYYKDQQTSYVFAENSKKVCGIHQEQTDVWPLSCEH